MISDFSKLNCLTLHSVLQEDAAITRAYLMWSRGTCHLSPSHNSSATVGKGMGGTDVMEKDGRREDVEYLNSLIRQIEN